MRIQLAAALISALALVSCSSDKETAEDVADELADALVERTLPEGLFTGGSQQSAQSAYEEIIAGLDDETGPEVELLEVTEDEGAAEATLSWRWDLGRTVWEYESAAELTETETGWQAQWTPELVEPSLSDGESFDVVTLLPRRADILGARGVPLVTERPVVRYGIDKTQVRPAQAVASARRVAGLLDITAAPYVKAVRAAGDKAFVEALVLRPEDAREVDPELGSVPGAVALDDQMPLAPTRDFAAAILGRVGPVTAELVEESEGRLAAGDIAGLSGLQARYDEQLTGTKGLEVRAVADDGTSRTLHTEEPTDGEPLRTTLDLRLQTRAERVLAPETDVPAALVAIRPSTGEIVAAASGPGAAGINVATYGQYAPGSTFKLVTTLALLRSGLRPDSPMECPTSVVVDGKRFENYDDYPSAMLGRIDLRQAVAHSCNTAFIGYRSRLDAGTLGAAAESLGLGTDYDLGFPAYFGQVPPPESETEAAADLIGQGRVLASPLVMAAVVASIQSGGTVVPHLLEEHAPEAEPATPLTRSEAAALRGVMRAVVTQGSGAFLGSLPGEVGAKTGTAEYGEPGPGGSLPTHAWMVAFQGDLAVAVFVETGESGSQTAGPLLESFLAAAGG